MTTDIDDPLRSADPHRPGGILAWVGLALGGAGLALFFLELVAGPFAPVTPVETTIVETARAIRDAALGAARGEPLPGPEPVTRSIDDWITIASTSLGLLGLGLSVVIFLTGPRRDVAAAGIMVGGAAVLAIYLWWLALLVCGMILLVTIVANLGEILDGFG